MFHKVDLMDLLSIFYALRTALGTMKNKKYMQLFLFSNASKQLRIQWISVGSK